MKEDKKSQQLGMNYSTASNRLVKDILFSFVIESGHVCHKCGGDLTRDTFSIEHIEPWLDSDDPTKLFFDLKNIAFSHFACNIKAARKNCNYECGSHAQFKRGCKCDKCLSGEAERRRRTYTYEQRRRKYEKHGY